ncbi:MAG: 30S ribosome-binding factor RbfA [bacterium]|nr:30S ribosome-binding factor RbfA [bacterium]
MKERRKEKINDLIKKQVAIILQQEIDNPQKSLVTVTHVEIDSNLNTAKIYVRTLGDEIQSLKFLNRAAGFIRYKLAHKIRLKTVPKISFNIDNSLQE